MLYYQSWFYFSWCPETLWFPKNPFLSSPFFHENIFDMSFGKALTATTICQAYHMPEMFWYAVNCAYKGFSNRCGRLFKETLQWKQCDPWVRGFILNHSSVIYPLTITQKENARLISTIYTKFTRTSNLTHTQNSLKINRRLSLLYVNWMQTLWAINKLIYVTCPW